MEGSGNGSVVDETCLNRQYRPSEYSRICMIGSHNMASPEDQAVPRAYRRRKMIQALYKLQAASRRKGGFPHKAVLKIDP
jgi:hypothetical protein